MNTGITVNVQDRIGVNIALELGQVTETVEVTGAAPILQTDTSTSARWSRVRRLSICR